MEKEGQNMSRDNRALLEEAVIFGFPLVFDLD